jgi:hypothetical protein
MKASNWKFLFAILSLVGLLSACSQDQLPEPQIAAPGATIWDGPMIDFTKVDNTDPNQEANQDRITDNVWITRGLGGGQIFNIKTETAADKQVSPAGTLWALGVLEEIEGLSFQPFRTAIGKPRQAVDQDMVMYLVEDDIYLQVRLTSWSSQGRGGFSYMRSTAQ